MTMCDDAPAWADADLAAAGIVAPASELPESDQILGWLNVATAAFRGESFLVWTQYQAAGEVFDLILAETYDQITDQETSGAIDHDKICEPYSTTAARLALAFRLHQRTAEVLLDEACASRTRLPESALLLRDGIITPDQFRTAVKRTDLVDDPDRLAAIDARIAQVLRGIGPGTAKHTADVVDRIVMREDPEAVRRREEAASRRKNARARNLEDGLGAVTITASAEDAQLAMASIDALIAGVCDEDPRTKAQLRSAAAIARLQGLPFTCGCGHESCAARLDQQAVSDRQARIVLHAICDSSTLAGGDEPGHLDGHGTISPGHVRDLAERPDTLVRPLDLADLTRPTEPDAATDSSEPEPADPAPGRRQRPRPDEPGARPAAEARPDAVELAPMALPSDPYRLATVPETVIRFLWGTCSVPGCDEPAWRCDLDHVTEFDQVVPAAGGPTCLCNVAPKCRFHHLLKTFAEDWTDDLFADEQGNYWSVIITPEGFTATAPADDQWLFPKLARLRCGHCLVDVDETPPPEPRAETRTEAKHRWRLRERSRRRRRREAIQASHGPPPF